MAEFVHVAFAALNGAFRASALRRQAGPDPALSSPLWRSCRHLHLRPRPAAACGAGWRSPAAVLGGAGRADRGRRAADATRQTLHPRQGHDACWPPRTLRSRPMVSTTTCSNLSTELRNVRVVSPRLPDAPPFLEIDRARVDVSPWQVLRGRYVVQAASADGVRVHYFVNEQGIDNLPRSVSDPESTVEAARLPDRRSAGSRRRHSIREPRAADRPDAAACFVDDEGQRDFEPARRDDRGHRWGGADRRAVGAPRSTRCGARPWQRRRQD